MSAKKDPATFQSDLRLVPCLVEPGMFKGEYLVLVKGFKPGKPDKEVIARLFADENEVRGVEREPKSGDPSNALLVVSLIGGEGGLVEVILPQPAQPLGVRLLVEEARLQEVEVTA